MFYFYAYVHNLWVYDLKIEHYFADNWYQNQSPRLENKSFTKWKNGLKWQNVVIPRFTNFSFS